MSKISQPRLLAYDALKEILDNGAYANIKVPDMLREVDFSERDRGFVTELVYGTLRWIGKYNYIIATASSRAIPEIDKGCLRILQLACHEIFQMRTPDRAVLFEYGEITKLILGHTKLSFVNAVLRKITNEIAHFSELELPHMNELQTREIKYSHPAWIIKAFYDQRKDWNLVDQLLEKNNQPAQVHAVVYPGRISEQYLTENGGAALNHAPLGAIGSHFIHDKNLAKGAIGIQDEGSQIISEIFLATVSESDSEKSWLDLCAGPGGKAAYLYNWLKMNRGNDTFTANELHPHRAELMTNRIPNSIITINDGTDIKAFNKTYDRIIVDAPCTGLGAIRRRPESRWRKSENDLKGLLMLQKDLLTSAYELLAADGIMAYVTCSPHLWETKGQMLDLLNLNKDLKPVEIKKVIEGSNLLNKDALNEACVNSYSLQLWSDIHGTDSMYLALLRKS